VVVNDTPLTVVTVVVLDASERGGFVEISSMMSDRDAKRVVWLIFPGPNRESTKSELQVMLLPATVQPVSDVTVTPSAVNVCTDRWLDAPVRHRDDVVPG